MKPPLIPVLEAHINDLDCESVNQCLQSGWVSTSGNLSKEFEKNLAEFLRIDHVLATCSGTAALHLALLSIDCKPGDIILIPDLTFISSVNTIAYCGAHPVFVDIDPSNLNINISDLKKALEDLKNQGKFPKALLIVHLLGNCGPMDEIIEICNKEGIEIIEDTAQALGSQFKDKFLGTFGSAAATSFNGNKLITSGGGGAVFLKNLEDLKKVQLIGHQYKNLGKDYVHEGIGYNYLMPSLNASLGISQLKRLKTFIDQKKKIYEKYLTSLKSAKTFKIISPLLDTKSNHWINVLHFNLGFLKQDIESIQKSLQEKNILTQKFYYPLHKQKPYAHNFFPRNLKYSSVIYKELLMIPSSPFLTEDLQERVIDVLLRLDKTAR